MASEAGPYKPDDQERDRYYYGFTNNSRLAARTSANRWSELQHEHGWGSRLVQSRKIYLPLVDQQIISAWTERLSLQIIEMLNQCSWSYFFPIRIGLERDAERVRPSTVLMIAVEPDSIQWDKGIAIALECRTILRAFNITNVEAEIREGQYRPHGASAQLEKQIVYNDQYSRTNDVISPMLSSLGYPIAYLEDRRGQGSAGLHLKLGDDESTVYSLTCRHVVGSNRALHESDRLSDKHRQYHVQASESTFSACVDKLEEVRENLLSLLQPLEEKKDRWGKWYIHDETKKSRCPTEKDNESILHFPGLVAYHDRVTELVKVLQKKKERKIGHLAFHSSFELSAHSLGTPRIGHLSS